MFEKKQEIKKHIAILHCANTLSLLQRKISNALLYHAYPELLEKQEHQITVKALCRIINYNGNNHAAIKNAIKGLITTLIEWNIFDEIGVEDWTASTILASVRLKGPNCIYAYSPRMKELLYSPAIYGKVNLIIQSRFKSSYGLALYENCVRYQGLPQTRWFDYDVFRKLMGVPHEKYIIFRDFNRRVLSKAVAEVNAFSNLIIKPDIKKKGRAIHSIRFLLETQSKKNLLDNNIEQFPATKTKWINVNQTTIYNKLIASFGFSTEQAKEIIGKYDSEYILQKINILESSKNFKIGNVTNLSGYFISALKKDYQPAHSSKLLRIKNSKQIEEQNEKLQREINKQEGEQEKYEKYIKAKLDQYLEMQEINEKNKLTGLFKRQLVNENNTLILAKLQKGEPYDNITLATLRNYLKNNKQFLNIHLPSFEEWLQFI